MRIHSCCCAVSRLECRLNPTRPVEQDLLSALGERYPYVGLVHRLDTPTGGVMLYSLKQNITGRLSALVQDHEAFCKEYLAVLAAPISPAAGEMSDFLFHDKRRNKAFVVDGKRGGSKLAKLSYQTLSTAEDGRTLIKIRLYTGRTHQIRVQFASRGRPLCGDGKYGSRVKAPNIALWSHRVVFVHPVTRRTVEALCAPEPVFPWDGFAELSRASEVER